MIPISAASVCVLTTKKGTPESSGGVLTAQIQSAKGHISDIEIEDIANDARCITLSNHGQNNQSLYGWKIVRNLDNGARILRYEFPADAVIKPGMHLKVWFSSVPFYFSNRTF